MSIKSREEKLESFLRQHPLASLATVSSAHKAHASSVFYFTDESLNFYFMTKDSTVKYKNMQKNNKVALVVSDQTSLQTVQVEGVVKEVDHADEIIAISEKLIEISEKSSRSWEALPISKIKRGAFAFFKITPTSIRWIDFNKWNNNVQFEQYF